MIGLAGFFKFAREREDIRLKRAAGLPGPWTEDPILSTFRFCNVFREDDRTTVWFRDNVRNRLWTFEPEVLIATVAFRWFNRIETGKLILPWLQGGWQREGVEAKLRPLQKAKEQLFTGAYLIKSPGGIDKLTGILDCIDNVVKAVESRPKWDTSLQVMHEWLMQFPYMGRFMAYEVVTDLRFTALCGKARDVDSWASAGPGAARGAGWVVHDDPDRYGYTSDKDQVLLLTIMRDILEASKNADLWPSDWRQWEMREVEHVLCEYDKWRRGHQGQSLKRKFLCK